MDAVRLSKLIAEIGAQMTEIDACAERVEARAATVDPRNAGSVEALGYQLHNLYNAAEDLLKIVASAFENQIEDSAAWHRGLVHQLSLNIEGVRPALVSADSLPGLDELRRFRHVFRHAYGAALDADRTLQLLAVARSTHVMFRRDSAEFVQKLRTIRDSGPAEGRSGDS